MYFWVWYVIEGRVGGHGQVKVGGYDIATGLYSWPRQHEDRAALAKKHNNIIILITFWVIMVERCTNLYENVQKHM